MEVLCSHVLCSLFRFCAPTFLCRSSPGSLFSPKPPAVLFLLLLFITSTFSLLLLLQGGGSDWASWCSWRTAPSVGLSEETAVISEVTSRGRHRERENSLRLHLDSGSASCGRRPSQFKAPLNAPSLWRLHCYDSHIPRFFARPKKKERRKWWPQVVQVSHLHVRMGSILGFYSFEHPMADMLNFKRP